MVNRKVLTLIWKAVIICFVSIPSLIYLLLYGLFRKLFGRKKRNSFIALISRSDLFPTNHGSAVKIVFTAKGISHFQEVILITQDNDSYYLVKNGSFTSKPYPFVMKWAFYIPLRFLRQWIEKSGIPQVESYLYSPKIDFNFKVRVLYLVLKYRITVLQSESHGGFYACSWVDLFFPLTKSVVEHNIEFDRMKDQMQLAPEVYQLIRDWELAVYQKADLVVTVSEDDKQILENNGIGSRRIHVIPSGVDLEIFNCKPEEINRIRVSYGISPADIVLIFHGVLCYGPNHQAIGILRNEILPRLRQKGYDKVKLFIVGRYPPFEFSGDRIIFTDAVDKLPPYILAANIAVVPLLAGGGTRLKILEYFAAKIPVISTHKGAEGIPAQNGQDIILVDEYDQMVTEIAKMIEDEDWRKYIGNNGNRFVQALDWKKIGERYIHLYQEMNHDKLPERS